MKTRNTEECRVKMEAETGVTRLQAKEGQELWPPPEIRKRQGRLHSESQREHGPANTLISDFRS